MAQRGRETYLMSHSTSVPSWPGTQSFCHLFSVLLPTLAVAASSGALLHLNVWCVTVGARTRAQEKPLVSTRLPYIMSRRVGDNRP